MLPLDQDLKSVKNSIVEFYDLTIRVLNYLPNVLSGKVIKNDYAIHFSEIAGTKKFIRPINQNLFYYDVVEFKESFKGFVNVLEKVRSNGKALDELDKNIIDSVLYTIQQAIGIELDLVVGSNSARKHVGNRFEELIKAVFSEIGIANKKLVLQIPYETEDGVKLYKCENDLILSPYKNVRSTFNNIDEREIVVSIKTTSKDRMGKIFIDKLLLEKFVGHTQKIIGIFLNDVQRKQSDNISFTLVSGLFMVYSKFLTELNGIYYLDPPPNANKSPYNRYMKPFSKLISEDIFKLLSS